MLAPIYIAELSPPEHRGKLVSLNLFAIFLGQSMAFYSRIIFCVMSVVSIIGDGMLAVIAVRLLSLLFIFLLFVPESPRWLVEKKQMDAALKILTRINGVAEARREFEEIKTKSINASKVQAR